MLPLLLLAAATAAPAPVDRCRPAIERKLAQPLLNSSVDSVRKSGRSTIVRGRFTIAQGTPPAPPGSMRPFHLIRLDYHFTCWVRAGKVRKLVVAESQ